MIKLFKKGNILIAVAVMLAVSLAAFAMNFTVAKADNVDERPAADVVLDMDTVSAWLEVGGNKVGNEAPGVDAQREHDCQQNR